MVTVLLSGESAERLFYPIVVDGASGSGKTRLCVELFLELDKNKDNVALKDLAYARVDMKTIQLGGGNEDHIQGIIRQLLKTYAEEPQNIVAALAQPTLKWLVDSVFPHSGKVALFVHLDEFQMNEEATKAFLREVFTYNGGNASRPILLVCSGLYASAKQLGLASSSERIKLEVRYLNDASTYELVRKAALAFCDNPDESWAAVPNFLLKALPGNMSTAPPLVRHLVEDTGGWALACVQLGVELANMGKRALLDLNQNDLKTVETNVYDQLKHLYQQDISNAMKNLSVFGLAKLLLLAMSPVSVSVRRVKPLCFFAASFLQVRTRIPV